MGAEKWIEINVKIFGDGSEFLFPMFKDMFNISVEDAIGAAKLADVVATLELGPDNSMEFAEFVEESPERVVERRYKCTWMERYKDFKVPHAFIPCDKGGCQAWSEEGLKAINPKINYKMNKSLAGGDPYCELVYEFKEE
jgi:hypothetical protein